MSFEIVDLNPGPIDYVELQQGPPGIQGPPGPPGGAGTATQLNFAYGDATPALIATVTANKNIMRIDVLVDTVFNGTNAAVTIGDAGDNDSVVSADQIDLTAVGTYQINPTKKYGSNTAVNLYITPGAGASTGTGVLFFYVEV